MLSNRIVYSELRTVCTLKTCDKAFDGVFFFQWFYIQTFRSLKRDRLRREMEKPKMNDTNKQQREKL